MERLLLEVDDQTARELERVAPVRKRMRAEFIRNAIRRALDLALDRETEAAYRAAPLPSALLASDLLGWDENNALAAASTAPPPERRRARKKRARP